MDLFATKQYGGLVISISMRVFLHRGNDYSLFSRWYRMVDSNTQRPFPATCHGTSSNEKNEVLKTLRRRFQVLDWLASTMPVNTVILCSTSILCYNKVVIDLYTWVLLVQGKNNDLEDHGLLSDL